MTETSFDPIRAALDGVAIAAANLDAVMRAEYPEGSEVRWSRRSGKVVAFQHGRIVKVEGGRAKVRNAVTGNSYWVEARQLCRPAP